MSIGSGVKYATPLVRPGRWLFAAAALFSFSLCPTRLAAQAADVSIEKTAFESPVEAGTFTTYTLVVTNNGPGVANGVVVNDTLPAGSEFFTVTSLTEGECTQLSNTVTCRLGDMQPGETDTIVIGAVINGSGRARNQAVVRIADGCDPDISDNISSAVVTLTGDGGPGADITLTQLDIPDPVLVGSLVTYSVTIHNNGPLDATGVVLTDTIPSGTDFVGATSTGPFECVFLSGTLTCEFDSLPDETSHTVNITVRPRFAGPKLNVAAVYANQSSTSNLSDNTVPEVTQVIGSPVCSCCQPETADLDLTKTASPNPVAVGEELTYTMTVVNNGPSTATNVLITDELPESVTFVSATTSQGSVQTSGTTIIGAVDELAAGESATLTIVVIPNQFGLLTNTATATSDQSDATAATDTSVITVEPSPVTFTDLAVTKSVTPTNATVGEHFTYNITVTNNGEETSGIVVTDTLSTGVILVSAGSSQGTVTRSGSTLTFNIGTLPSGGSAAITIIAFSKQEGTILNTVTVASNSTDTNPANDTATATVTVGEITTDLCLTKTALPNPATVGQPLTYTLVVSNCGENSDPAVVVRDTLPAGVTFVSASTTQGSVNELNGVVTAQVGRLNSGQSATIIITVIPNAAGTITNTAVAEGARADANTTNNTPSVTTEVAAAPAEANLAVTKTADRTRVSAGELITYTVTVTNNGPATATNVRIREDLPANAEYVSCASTAGVVKNLVNGDIDAMIASLAPGASATITVVVRATGPAGTLVNNVTVTADQADPVTADNTATVAIPVERSCVPDLTGEWKMSIMTSPSADGNIAVDGWLNVCNIGGRCPDTPPEVFLDFYLSDDAEFSFGDTLLQCFKIPVPRAGECKVWDLHAQVPAGTNLSGKFIIAVIDPTLGLDETRENNNYIIIPIQ